MQIDISRNINKYIPTWLAGTCMRVPISPKLKASQPTSPAQLRNKALEVKVAEPRRVRDGEEARAQPQGVT